MKKTTLPARKPNGAAFSELLDEAAQCARELRRLEKSEVRKLSGPAFVAAAMQIAGCDAEALKRLRERLPRFGTRGPVNTSLNRLVAAFRSENWLWPTREVRRLRTYLAVEAQAQLASVGADVFTLAALAAQIASEQHPESFGEGEDVQTDTNRLVELTVRADILRQRLEREFTGADLAADGTFKLTNGTVKFGPNCGRHLIDWRLARDHGDLAGG